MIKDDLGVASTNGRHSSFGAQLIGIAFAIIAGSSLLAWVTHDITVEGALPLPGLVGATAAGGLLCAVVLFQRFVAGNSQRVLVLGNGFLFSGMASVAIAAALPGGLASSRPDVVSHLWALGEVGFGLLVATGLIAGPRLAVVTRNRRTAAAVSALLTTALVALALIVLLATKTLPTIFTAVAIATLFPAILIALARRSNFESRIERSLFLAVSVCFGHAILGVSAAGIETLTWQLGVVLSAVAPALVVAAVVSEATRAQHRSEFDKRILENEALDLLREKRSLEYRQDRIRRIVDNAADAYIELGLGQRIQGWNTKAAEIFGPDAISSTGSLDEVFDTETLVLLEGLWTDPQRFNGVVYEATAKHVAGHFFAVDMTVWVDESDMEPKMSMFVRDITVHHETQQRLQNALNEERRAVLRLQELDAAKNDFVSSISHELRSPLTSTLGFLEILADGDAGELSERQLKMVQTAERNAKRLLFLIEDLLTLSHIESGTFGVKYTPVSIKSALRTAIGRHSDLAAQRNVSLETDFQGVLGVCPGEEIQLVRALSSIVSNAVKFTPPSGHVRIGAVGEGDTVAITVSDDGIGIPRRELHHLFDRFYKTSTSLEQQHQGAGLGLTIAKAIIEHHGGSVNIDSTEGVGTTVVVRLPMLPSLTEQRVREDSIEKTNEAIS